MRCHSESKLEVTVVNETISYKGLCCISRDIAIQNCSGQLLAVGLNLIVSIWCLLTIPLQNGKLC